MRRTFLTQDARDLFRQELRDLINRHSLEGGSDTPDFVLAEHLTECLETFDRTVSLRAAWYAGKEGSNSDDV